MFTIVDFIKNIVSSLEFTEYVDNITQTSTETQFDTCRTHQVTKGNYIVINGIKYKVKDFELNTWISVSGVVPLPFDSYTILAPNFFNGTPMMVSNVLADIRDWKKKLPMVYLLEVIREQRFNSRTNKLDRISDLRIFFLMSSNFEDWDISQHYDLAIEPMDNFLNDFIHALRYNAQVGEFDEYETINRANFGVYISKPSKRSGKYEDNITKLIDENVSGVELRINLPIQKNPCFSFPPDCPVPPTPIPPPPTFENLFSLNLDGVDDHLTFTSEWFAPTTPLNATDGNHIGSVSMWFKSDDVSQFDYLLGLNTSFGTSYFRISFDTSSGTFGNNSNLRVLLLASDNAGGTTSCQSILYDSGNPTYSGSSISWQPETWYHLAVVFDKNATNRLTVYLDGVAYPVPNTTGSVNGMRNIGTTPYSLPYTTTGSIAQNQCRIGAYFSSLGAFAGNIDEVSLFSTAKTQSEITSIYNSGNPTDLSALAGLTNWYRNGDNGTWKSPQWLVPNNENKEKVSNYSFLFDGVDDSINTGVSALDGASAFTISCWVNSSYTNWQNLFGDNSIRFATKPSITRLDLSFDLAVVFRSYDFVLNVGQWHNVVITFDGSLVQADRLKVYVDTIQVTNSLAGTPSTTFTASSDFRIGRSGTSGIAEWNGNIDEFATWNSVQNITDLYNSGVPSILSGTTNWWRMGEDATFSTNWTVPDQVGSNDGTSANMTIEDRIGNSPNSTNNALSLNMDEVDRETDVPT